MAASRLAHAQMVHIRRARVRLYGWYLEPACGKHHIDQWKRTFGLVGSLVNYVCTRSWRFYLRFDLGIGISCVGAGYTAMSPTQVDRFEARD